MFFLKSLTFCSYQKSIIRTIENSYKSIICLKTDTVLLLYTFYQFKYFITTCYTDEIYQQRSQSKSFNGNGLMVLFNLGRSRLINKLSLIRSLNLFASVARIAKWIKSIKQLHSSRWSDTADCLTYLRCLLVKLEITMCSAALVKKWWYDLP